MLAKIERLEAEKKTAEAERDMLKEKNEAQRLRILYLERQVFGRRSEKRLPDADTAQLSFMDQLFGEESLDAEKAVQPIAEQIAEEAEVRRNRKPAPKNGASRREFALPKDLERRITVMTPEMDNPEDYERIGTDVTERLMREPARFYVERIERPIYKRKHSMDGTTEIVQSPLPKNIIEGSRIGHTVLSSLVVDKYCHHIPEYRQAKMYRESGVDLPTSTINRLTHKLADILYPLYCRLMELTLGSDYIQIDETVENINDTRGKARKGYLWAVRSVPLRTQFFYYKEGSRGADVCRCLLKDFKGAFQSDGYAVYSAYEDKSGVLPLGCLAHVRRHFESALQAGVTAAQKALDYIAILYTLEANLKERGADAETIRRERKEKAWPILQAMEAWMQHEWTSCTPKSPLGKAISYAHGMWIRIGRYCLDGRYEIDNSAIERSIRPVTVGRKNYLFCGNDEAAEDTALYYSLIGSCGEVGMNPRAWFDYVLPRIRPDMTDEELDSLLPVNVLLH